LAIASGSLHRIGNEPPRVVADGDPPQQLSAISTLAAQPAGGDADDGHFLTFSISNT